VLTKKAKKRGLPNSRTCLIRGDGPHHVEIEDYHTEMECNATSSPGEILSEEFFETHWASRQRRSQTRSECRP
jgi:hypothetical protein